MEDDTLAQESGAPERLEACVQAEMIAITEAVAKKGFDEAFNNLPRDEHISQGIAPFPGLLGMVTIS